MYNRSKLTAVTMSLPSFYSKGIMEIDEQQAEQVLKRAYENGVRNFTTAPHYLMGKCEEFVGKLFKDVRKEVCFSTNFAFFDPSLPKENPVMYSANNSLKSLQTDYIDYFYFYTHNLNMDHIKEASTIRETGIIKNVGIILEPHNLYNVKDILEKAIPYINTVMIYFIPAMAFEHEIFSELKKNGIRIVAAGLLDIGSDYLPDKITSITGDTESISATEVAARYFLKQEFFDEVTFILNDKSFLDLVCECEKTIDKYTLPQLEAYFQKAAPIPEKPAIICSGCGYCLPCPKGIDITKLFNIYAYFDQYGMRDSAIYAFYRYMDQLGDRIENICKNCGICEKRCFHMTPISSGLRELECFMDKLSSKSV